MGLVCSAFCADPWSLDVHTWQLGQYSCRSTESCLSVMVRWVASSGHVADDCTSGQEVEVLQNFLVPQLCVTLCFVCSLFCK